jgi:hypothetical protein
MAKNGVHINVSNNLDEVAKYYKKLQRYETPKQYGFAINDTARDIVKILNRAVRKKLHKPNKLTTRSFGWVRSRSSQKTIEEKVAWVGRKGASGLPMFKVEGKDFSKQQLAQKRTARVYKDLWKRLSQGGVRVPLGKDTLMYPSTNSKKLGVMEGRAGQTLSFKTIKNLQGNKKEYFTGKPRGKFPQSKAVNYNGVWKRLPPQNKTGKKNGNLLMVASLVKTQNYNKKIFRYDLIVKSAYPRLIRKHFAKQMKILAKSVKRKKIRRFRKAQLSSGNY